MCRRTARTVPGHACFAVAEDDLDGWKARLEAAGVAIEQEMDVAARRPLVLFPRPRRQQPGAGHARIWGLPEVEAALTARLGHSRRSG